MTQPNLPSDRQLARDVARQIDRRRVRRRMTLWSALLALVAGAAFYLRCGDGLGLGGFNGNGGDGGGGAPRTAVGPRRCAIRMSASGIALDGKPTSRDEVIAACKTAAAVDIYKTGDVRHGDPDDLAAALEAAGAKNVALHDPPTPVGSPGDPARN